MLFRNVLHSVQVACVALRTAAEKTPSRQFVRTQHSLVGMRQGVVELRRKRTDIGRGFVRGDRQGKLVISRIRSAAVRFTKAYGQWITRGRRTWFGTSSFDIPGPLDVESLLSPYHLKQPAIGT